MPTNNACNFGTLTQYDILVGGAANAISSVGPGTSGQILQSAGNAANPAYSTSTYPTTNAVSTLLYASSANVMGALTTANNGVLITSASGVPSWLADGTTGQVLTATTGSPPTWSTAAVSNAFDQVTTQVFTSSGTYTPTTGMKYCIVEVVGGGGGGAGIVSPTSTGATVGGGGGGGGYAIKAFSSATIGGSQTVTIGAAGTAGSNSGGTGGTGGTTTLGALLSATGGVGGAGSGATSSQAVGLGGAGGAGSSGDVNLTGGSGGNGIGFFVTGVASIALSGYGGSTKFSGSIAGPVGFASTVAGTTGNLYGGGGSGAAGAAATGANTGGVGTKGLVFITEFLSV